MTSTVERDRYYAVEDAIDAHLATCTTCTDGNGCAAAIELLGQEHAASVAFKAADPAYAAAYDRDAIPPGERGLGHGPVRAVAGPQTLNR